MYKKKVLIKKMDKHFSQPVELLKTYLRCLSQLIHFLLIYKYNDMLHYFLCEFGVYSQLNHSWFVFSTWSKKLADPVIEGKYTSFFWGYESVSFIFNFPTQWHWAMFMGLCYLQRVEFITRISQAFFSKRLWVYSE